MSNLRPWRVGSPPDSRPTAYPMTRAGSKVYLTHALIELRRVATKLGVDVHSAWRKSGRVVETNDEPVLDQLRKGLRSLLDAPALKSAPLDPVSLASVSAAIDLLASLTA